MAKIGTAHVEIKPVLNDEALEAIVRRIELATTAGVARGIANGARTEPHAHCPTCEPGAHNADTTNN